ncbi:putative membrane-bound lytic murein transglycosylase [Bradyrhizobium sp. ORS 278]|uniref:murein transglycosylase A n=1 Tax=Bradyrhizobium sp. (strain ORS 278) TaxID=114615 RepID=UPI0001507A8D|nr:MltA domain-containing protein [Bradyrhizobium sp. ORS 278]CAL74170.1 putative membrane-bound lytic murein transglycosylase [Bradyrhizobium sp. ORS 278]
MVREIWKRVFTARSLRYWTPALALSVAAVALAPYAAEAVRARHRAASPPMRHLPYPQLDWPMEITNSQYQPLSWSDVPGWNDDDQLAAYRTFRASCKPIAAKTDATPEDKALGDSLRDPCREARTAELADSAAARAFFERHFEPLKISKLGDADGFVTGYYEPVIEGSRTQNEVYNVPVYRRPSNLFVRGFKQDSASLPNKGPVYRKIGRRKLVPYYDRAEIEDGAIEGRGLEIAWLRNQTDLLFAQIQGSARISLDDGSTVRINYDAYNGHPYTPVGRILIERGIIPREQMSMQRIREWMEQNPQGADELRRMNRSYIFFREVQLSEKDEAVGAQGIPLTPGRSIAVDKSLHVYGTPFFITGELPIDSEKQKNPFHRLMIAQDTGSAIVGPARADLYFGAGQEAGKVSGRLKHSIQFVMLVPKSLDPVARGRKMPLPDARPSERIAKLFPQVLPKEPVKDAQTEPAKDQSKDPAKSQDQPSTAASSVKDAKAPAPAAGASATTTVAQNIIAPVPLPEARPRLESDRNSRRLRYGRRHRNHP